MQIAIDFAKIFEKSRNFCQWSAKGSGFLSNSLESSQILVFSLVFTYMNSMPKSMQENTNSVSELPVRKRTQTDRSQRAKILQKLSTRHTRSATSKGKILHRSPCRILPPSKPSIGIRFMTPRDKLERQNSCSHFA